MAFFYVLDCLNWTALVIAPKARLQLQKALPQQAAFTPDFCHYSSHFQSGQRGSTSFPWWPRSPMSGANTVLHLHKGLPLTGDRYCAVTGTHTHTHTLTRSFICIRGLP
jgi:hypothetical protein